MQKSLGLTFSGCVKESQNNPCLLPLLQMAKLRDKRDELRHLRAHLVILTSENDRLRKGLGLGPAPGVKGGGARPPPDRVGNRGWGIMRLGCSYSDR